MMLLNFRHHPSLLQRSLRLLEALRRANAPNDLLHAARRLYRARLYRYDVGGALPHAVSVQYRGHERWHEIALYLECAESVRCG